jgi:hypothetical protein
VTLSQGILTPGTLVAGSEDAVLDATFTSFRRLRLRRTRRLSWFGRPFALPTPGRPEWTSSDLADLVVVDEAGTHYSPCHVRSVSFGRRFAGEPGAPADLEIRLEPAPPAEATWIELQGRGGSPARLVRGQQTQPSLCPVVALEGKEIETLARSLLAFSIFGVKANHPEAMRQQCQRALSRAAELRASPAPCAPGSLFEDLSHLCTVLQGDRGDVAELPPRWAAPLMAADLQDGPVLHLNIGTALPVFDSVELALGALISEPSLWHISMSAGTGRWHYSDDKRQKRPPFSVRAEDERGGHYVSMFWGSTGTDSREDLALRFRPRLDPKAQLVRLIFEGPGASLTTEIDLQD